MNIIAFFVALVIFCFILAAIFWIGFYIVLPIVLMAFLLSGASSLLKKFMSGPDKQPHAVKQKNQQNQVIDVEFEEIKE